MFKNTICFATYKNEIFNWTKRFDLRFDLIGNKIAGKIISLSKKPFKELHNSDEIKEEDAEITTHKKRYISPEESQQIIDELRLVPKKDAYF